MVHQGDKHRIAGEVRFVVCQAILWAWESLWLVGLGIVVVLRILPAWSACDNRRSQGSVLVGKNRRLLYCGEDKQRLIY